MKPSRYEGILEQRRKVETQQLSPMGNMTTTDAISIGLSNRAQAQFLRSSIFAINKAAGAFNRSRIE